MPKVIEHADIQRITQDYAEAAYRCREGGLDGVELIVSGHLIGQFWSRAANKRTDAYGGSLENRMRFGLEVLESIRERVGDRFIVSLRFTAKEGDVEGGITEEEGIEIARHHADTGLVDCLNVQGGANWTKAGVAETVPSMAYASGRFIELAAKVKRATGLPVLHAAGVADLATADFAVREGHVDLIGMTRAQIADPHLVRKHLAGEDAAIRPCVGAGFCIDRIYRGGDALCLHNVVSGRETILSHQIAPAEICRRVIIVGAGPAGLEAARVCAERGHAVTVLEAQSVAGGQVRYAAQIEWRNRLIGITRWLFDRCEALGVSFHFNCLAEIEDVLETSSDAIILATGGAPDMTTIKGADTFAANVWDVLSGSIQPGERVLVYDETGSQVGPTCAEYLATRKSRVDLVTPDRAIAQDVGVTNHAIHLRNLYSAGVDIQPDRRLKQLAAEGNGIEAHFDNEYSGQTEARNYDQVIVETGTVPNDDLYDGLVSRAVNAGQTDATAALAGAPQPVMRGANAQSGSFALFRIGDCVSARGIHAAILDANRLGRGI